MNNLKNLTYALGCFFGAMLWLNAETLFFLKKYGWHVWAHSWDEQMADSLGIALFLVGIYFVIKAYSQIK